MESVSVFVLLGILSSVIFLIGDLPYFLDTLHGRTKPHRVTWGIACLLNGIGFANQYASGASNSLWLFAAATIATGAIFVASLFKGAGGHGRLDMFAVVLAIAGVGLWALLDSPWFSILSTLVVVFVSFIPTFVKAKKHPESETRIAWLLGTISAALAAVSVVKLNWMLLVLPVNATLLQAYMVYILYFRVKRHRERPMTPTHGPAELIES